MVCYLVFREAIGRSCERDQTVTATTLVEDQPL